MTTTTDERTPTVRAFQYRNVDDGSTYFLYTMYLWDEQRWTDEVGLKQAARLLMDKGMAERKALQKLGHARRRFKDVLAADWKLHDSPRPGTRMGGG